MALVNYDGTRFGRYRVLKEGPPKTYPAGKTHRTLVCECDCGTIKTVLLCSLRTGATVSCGCYHRDEARNSVVKRCKKHGHAARQKKSKTFKAWTNMRRRCLNPDYEKYKYYGARGITICDRWLGEHGFGNFLADMGECPKGKSLDRYPDKNGNYDPDNCRWATQKEQTNNTRRNVVVWDGRESLTLAQVADKHGLPYKRLWRLCRVQGLSAQEAIEITKALEDRANEVKE